MTTQTTSTSAGDQRMQPASALAGSGLLAYLNNLAKGQAYYEERANQCREFARQAAEQQPAHPVVAQTFLTQAGLFAAAAREWEAAWTAARNRHADDFERANNPRGGIAVERRADVDTAVRDGSA